jgi:hypothetical protein
MHMKCTVKCEGRFGPAVGKRCGWFVCVFLCRRLSMDSPAERSKTTRREISGEHYSVGELSRGDGGDIIVHKPLCFIESSSAQLITLVSPLNRS